MFYPAVIYRLFLQRLRSFLLILHIRTLLPCPIDYVNELELVGDYDPVERHRKVVMCSGKR